MVPRFMSSSPSDRSLAQLRVVVVAASAAVGDRRGDRRRGEDEATSSARARRGVDSLSAKRAATRLFVVDASASGDSATGASEATSERTPDTPDTMLRSVSSQTSLCSPPHAPPDASSDRLSSDLPAYPAHAPAEAPAAAPTRPPAGHPASSSRAHPASPHADAASPLALRSCWKERMKSSIFCFFARFPGAVGVKTKRSTVLNVGAPPLLSQALSVLVVPSRMARRTSQRVGDQRVSSMRARSSFAGSVDEPRDDTDATSASPSSGRSNETTDAPRGFPLPLPPPARFPPPKFRSKHFETTSMSYFFIVSFTLLSVRYMMYTGADRPRSRRPAGVSAAKLPVAAPSSSDDGSNPSAPSPPPPLSPPTLASAREKNPCTSEAQCSVSESWLLIIGSDTSNIVPAALVMVDARVRLLRWLGSVGAVNEPAVANEPSGSRSDDTFVLLLPLPPPPPPP
eukprot:Rhum_TRINITY_DN14717_c28_g1::Rhum_TRINITY_DN14717_c28_g1_i1::g.114113::m.114113